MEPFPSSTTIKTQQRRQRLDSRVRESGWIRSCRRQRDVSVESVSFYDTADLQQRLWPYGISYYCSKEARSCTFDLRVKHRSASVRTLPPASFMDSWTHAWFYGSVSVSRFSFVSWNTESPSVKVRKILTLGCEGTVWLQREISSLKETTYLPCQSWQCCSWSGSTDTNTQLLLPQCRAGWCWPWEHQPKYWN